MTGTRSIREGNLFDCGLLLVAMSISLSGCQFTEGNSPPNTKSEIEIERFSFGNHDLTAINSQCTVKIGDNTVITIIGNKSKFPKDFSAGTAQIISVVREKDIVIQSCDIKVSREGDKVKVGGEMTIPQPPCSGKLQLLHGNKVMIERSVKIVEN